MTSYVILNCFAKINKVVDISAPGSKYCSHSIQPLDEFDLRLGQTMTHNSTNNCLEISLFSLALPLLAFPSF